MKIALFYFVGVFFVFIAGVLAAEGSKFNSFLVFALGNIILTAFGVVIYVVAEGGLSWI